MARYVICNSLTTGFGLGGVGFGVALYGRFWSGLAVTECCVLLGLIMVGHDMAVKVSYVWMV